MNNTPIEKFKIPFYVVVTDIENGQEVVFGKGNAGRAVRASCSIPGIFSPVIISNKMYVDGGVVSPVAVDVARKFGADVVIQPKVGYIGSAEVSKKHEAILEGEKAALEALPRIKEIVDKLKAEGRLE